ncbi:MAG: hypothetical protein QOJ75_1737 [Chloroflexota bacterium]|nr:hypothetical protein [Chloroflexota bacterium]
MILPILLLAAFIVPVLAVSAVAWWSPLRVGERLAASAWAKRLQRGHRALIAELGPLATGIGLLLAGSAAIVAVCWPLGKVAAMLERPVDVPVLEWMQAQASPTSALTSVVTQLTKMGDLTSIAFLALAAAALFAVLWRRRWWWIPPIVLALPVVAEAVLQRVLALLVDRGHPPTALGTYPSGGTARIIALSGVLFFLALATWPGIRPRWRAIGWTAVGLLGALEAFTRFYLLQHWPTDLVGGWIFGELLLLVILAAVWPVARLRPALIDDDDDETGESARAPLTGH